MKNHLITNNFAILGIGSFGVKIVSSLATNVPQYIRLYGIDSDIGCLNNNMKTGVGRIIVGTSITRGLGARGSRSIGKESLMDSEKQIRQIIEDTDSVFLFSGLGGGIGSGGLPIVAESCETLKKKVICAVTIPASFEGNKVKKNAIEGLSALLPFSDVVYVILTEFCGGSFDLSFSERLKNSSTAVGKIVESVSTNIIQSQKASPFEVGESPIPQIITVIEESDKNGFMLLASGCKPYVLKI